MKAGTGCRRREFIGSAAGFLLSGCSTLESIDRGLYDGHRSLTEEDPVTGQRTASFHSRTEQIAEGNAAMRRALRKYDRLNQKVDRGSYDRLLNIFNRVHAVSRFAQLECLPIAGGRFQRLRDRRNPSGRFPGLDGRSAGRCGRRRGDRPRGGHGTTTNDHLSAIRAERQARQGIQLRVQRSERERGGQDRRRPCRSCRLRSVRYRKLVGGYREKTQG